MTSRQKITIAAFAVIILIIIWQVMGLIGGGGSTTSTKPAQTATIKPVNKQPGQMTSVPPGAAPAGSVPSMSPPPAMTMQNPPGTPPGPPMLADQLREVPVPMNTQILELQKETEQKYVEQINQLQSLRVQKEIAETNQAIAAAKLATVTAEKSVSDLLTKPVAPPTPALPASAYANTLVNPTPSGTTVTTETTITPPAPAVVNYTVISVSMELGRWSAVLGLQGKLYNVSIGDVLPVDGSVVASINKSGVVLMKDGKRRKISLISSI